MRGTARLLAAPMTKARAAAKGASPAGKAVGKASADASAYRTKWIVELMRPVSKPPPLTDEERARRRHNMIAYGRLRRAQHNATKRMERDFLFAKWCAIDALPLDRKFEAFATTAPETPDDAPELTQTPPIPGFDIGNLTKK